MEGFRLRREIAPGDVTACGYNAQAGVGSPHVKHYLFPSLGRDNDVHFLPSPFRLRMRVHGKRHENVGRVHVRRYAVSELARAGLGARDGERYFNGEVSR